MASSVHNEETGGKFQCPIPSGWSFRLPFRAHLRFRLLRRSRGPRNPAIWRYKSQSPTDTNSKPPDRSQATRFDGGWQVAMLIVTWQHQPVRLWNPCEASLPHVFAREISHSWPQPNLHSGRLHTQWVDERLRAAEFASWMLDNFCTLGEQGSCRACEKCQGPLNGSQVRSTKGASTPTRLASEWMAWASIRMGSCKLLPLENLVGKSTFSARCLWSSKQQNFTMKEWW